jgi:hypothetical protein
MSGEKTTIPVWATLFRAYRVELWLFVASALVLAFFSGQRFWRQSAAPHFVYQAQAWLEGRTDIDVEVLPNQEDWACVREVGGVKRRCEGQLAPGDKWYSSFPFFPAVVMLPFVVVHGYQFNDTSFGVFIGALAIALFYSLLRLWREEQGLAQESTDSVAVAALLGFGTLFFYCAIRGEVWFSAEVMGVAFTALYLRHATAARNPALAGLFWSMAVLTRTPLFFTGVFFVLEALAPAKGGRMAQLGVSIRTSERTRLVLRFALGAAPLGALAAFYNATRFGSLAEFGHRFFFNNRVNVDIDTWGLFHPHYLLRNIEAAFVLLPTWANSRLGYSPWGLSLFLTLPFLALAVVSARLPKRALMALGAMVAVLVASALFPAERGDFPVGFRPTLVWLAVAGALGFLAFLAWQWVSSPDAPRLAVPLLLTLLVCALPGLLYQNTGYAQFGFRFSVDYTPYVMALVAVAGWRHRQPLAIGVALFSVVFAFWGAVGFRGYTELVRGW